MHSMLVTFKTTASLDELAGFASDLAHAVTAVPGLISKTWVANGDTIGGFYLFNAGVISMGAIIAIVMLAGRSLAPVGQLAFLMTRGRQAFQTLDSIQVMIDQEDERTMGSRSVVPEISAGCSSS